MTCGAAGLQAYGHTGLQAYGPTGLLTYWPTDLLVYWPADIEDDQIIINLRWTHPIIRFSLFWLGVKMQCLFSTDIMNIPITR